MSQAGIASNSGGGGGGSGIQKITPNSGITVLPDGSNNVNILGQYTVTTVGTLNTLTITPTVRGYPITPYVVGPATFAGYQTIQSAINAANAAGGNATVFIQPGTYNENLTLFQNINLAAYGGDAGDVEFTIPSGDDCSVIVTGTLTLNVSAVPSLSFNTVENIRFTPATGNVVTYNTNIALLPPSTLTFKNCILQGTQLGTAIFSCDGFPVINLLYTSITEVTPGNNNLFTLPGADKFLIINADNSVFDVNQSSACVVTDVSDIHLYLTDCFYGSMIDLTGASNSFLSVETRGCVFSYKGSVELPLLNFGAAEGSLHVQGGIYRGGSGGFCSSTVNTSVNTNSFFVINDVQFFNTLVLGNHCQDNFFGCNFYTNSLPAIIMNSSNNVSFADCVIKSTNNPAVSGTGAGTLTYTDITFLSNASFANTLTLATTNWRPYSIALASTDGTKVGTCNFNSAQFTVDTNGFVSISGTGVGETITGDSGGALSPTAGNWNILGRSGSKTSGSASTLTVKSPPYTDQGGSTTVTLNSGSSVTAAITLTLPASAGLADGDLFEFYCTTSGALIIQAVGAQKIRLGSLISSAAGTATSTNIGDSVSLRFRAADGFFYATSIIGTWVMA